MGYTAKIEEFRKGKAVDVGLTRGAESLALEIATSAAGELSNIIKDHRAGWSRILSIALDAKIRDQIQKEWEAEKPNCPDCQVEFHLITDPIFNSKPDFSTNTWMVNKSSFYATDTKGLRRESNLKGGINSTGDI